MEENKTLIDESYDLYFDNVQNLTWYPWVGSSYKTAERKVLIVGESHYLGNDKNDDYDWHYRNQNGDRNLTRMCIREGMIDRSWGVIRTYDNIRLTLWGTNEVSDINTWKNLSFINIVQRTMDGRIKEQPSWDDFKNGWEVLFDVIKVLKPQEIIFCGVAASNYFNQIAPDYGLKYTELRRAEKLNGTYSRTAEIKLADLTIPLTFIKHPASFFSWSTWRNYLIQNNAQMMRYLSKIGGTPMPEIMEVENEEIEKSLISSIPQNLSQIPVVAVDYLKYTGNEQNDVKFLSIGRSTYNKDSCSVKLFRKDKNDKWARNSEEIPLDRVADLTLLLTSVLKNIKNDPGLKNLDKSILNEQVVRQDDLKWLSEQFESESILTPLMNLKTLLNEMPFIK